MTSTGVSFDRMLATAKKAGAALRGADVPFAVAGGLAVWARGGPRPRDDDVDLFVPPAEAERALAALVEAGLRAERPPEGWLLKAYDGPALVDLIFEPSGVRVDDGLLERSGELDVDSMPMPVVPADDVVITQLMSWNGHHLDFEGLLELTRSLREQIDWARVRDTVKESPYARAFLFLAEELGIAGR